MGGGTMFGIKQILTGDWSGLWHAFQFPLIGAGVSLVLVLLGRLMRSQLLLIAAGGIGVATGWLLLTGGTAGVLTTSPRDLAGRLPLVAIAATLLAVVTTWLSPQRGRWPCLILLAVGAAWWLAGGPLTQADLMKVVIVLGALIAWHGLAARTLTRAPPGRLVLVAFTFVLALWAIKAPQLWLLLALVPALASLTLLAAPTAELMLLPMAIILAAVAAATQLANGRLPRGVNAIDAAVLAPVLALLLVGRLRFAAILAGPVALVVAVGLAWLAHLWLG